MEEQDDLTMKCSNCFYLVDGEHCYLQLDDKGEFCKVNPDSWCSEYHLYDDAI